MIRKAGLLAHKKIIFFCVIAALAASCVSAYFSSRYYLAYVTADVKQYLNTIKKIEQGYIEYIPLYNDYATPLMEMKLRTYLFQSHMEIAHKSGMAPIEHEDAIPDLVSSGKLINLESRPDSLYYFYNVSNKYRVLSPVTASGLSVLTKRFQQNIARRSNLPPVKIALSSALRPVSYQLDLREKNYNATIATTHSYGVSFDIFYDDYYVVLPAPDCSNKISEAVLEPVRTRMGFLMGDALREQFRSVLMETLIQLQDEGIIYAILEKQQRCYHVTVLPVAK
jgi:Family of unknown function (DUF5715)